MRRLKSCFPFGEGKWNSKICTLAMAVFLVFGSVTSAFADVSKENDVSDLNEQQAQTVTVSGRVQDTAGEPIPGVNIVVQGTTQGTITDMNGEYSLDAPADGTLIFSFIGFNTQNIPIEGRTTINVTMEEETLGLDEVVVTALGIKRETKKLGYGMTEVTGDEIASTNTVNPVQALQGKSTGLTIGASDGGLFGNSKIQIRGVSVLNSNNNQPIFVIDGVILDNPVSDASADWSSSANDFGNILKNLNPDDYESVSILKGAAATALYGSRGINGAVVITTKDGEGARGIGVSVTQSVGIDHVYNQPDIQYEFGPGALAGYTNYGEKDENGNYYRFSTNQFYTNADGIPTKRGHPWEWAGFGPRYDGRQLEDYDGSMTTYSPAKDNMLNA
jgi:iron complex outermembrane receptor protein